MAWLSPYHREFHNKAGFEARHGMKRFYDLDFFRTLGHRENHGWGLKDGTFLKAAVGVLQEVASHGKPVFAHVTTTGTHPPFATGADGPVPAALRLGGQYEGMVSRFVAADRAAAEFVTNLLASPMGGRTLIVLKADHGTGQLPPNEEIGEIRQREIHARIPIAFVTRDMPKPEVRHYPVHQVDVAPTIVEILGTGARDVAWLGRNVFAGSGTPWVFGRGSDVSYRVGDRGCWSLSTSHEPKCFDLSGGEPLLSDQGIRGIKEDPRERAFFGSVLKATRSAIEHNQLIDASP
jgi:phosphoglycerol transferase MdoB-like AlkP superfamily enzyme